MPDLSIRASIYPTEDEERINNAILNLFPDAKITIEDNVLNAISPNMNYFTQRVKEQKIQDSARQILKSSIHNNELIFYLNKQAAFMGKVNFTEGDSILGDIKIIIDADMPDTIIQQITGMQEDEK